MRNWRARRFGGDARKSWPICKLQRGTLSLAGREIACAVGVETPQADRAKSSAPTAWLHAGARVRLGLLLGACLALAARETVAHLFAATNSLHGFALAGRWDASNPEFPARYARKLGEQGGDADPREMARAFQIATRLGPRRAENWAGLGEALDLAGDNSGAARAYQRAIELFPRSPDINWQFANFLLRSGGAMAPLRRAMEGDPSLRQGAFDLAWRAGIPREQILQILPARQDILSAYLDYLDATGRVDAAADAWKRVLASPEPVNFDAACRYFDALLYAHRVDELAPVWAALAHHDPERIRWQPDAANRITNGGFEEPPLGGGFDWRIVPIEGADASFDTEIVHGSSRSLLLHFDGKHNLDFGHVVQYVTAEPDTRYRFIAYARSEGITTDSGPRIAVYDAYDRAALAVETEGVTGTTSWQEQRLEFHTGPKTKLLVVQLIRTPSRKLDNQIAGTLWLDDFSLTALR
jgi:tetratricopeptide (TPR) repeat protein